MPSLPRLSVVMFTDGPIGLVTASLELIRPVAHEIVVAVDARVDPEELGGLQGVADRVVRAEFVPPLEANLRWLHEQATGDWVLRLDSDDVPSDQLVQRLATPGWDAEITHAHVQYRWLWGGPDRVLQHAPWWPDPALRLIRNLPGIARFPHATHAAAEVAGAGAIWDVPLYHLDLLLQTPEERAAKAERYEHQNPGHRTDRGWSVSSTYYLPEELAVPPATESIPPVDAGRIGQVLAAGRSHAAPPPADLEALGPVVTAADRRPPAPSTGDARVRLLAPDPIVAVDGRSAIVTVGVTNLTTRTWRPTDEPAEQVGGRFLGDGRRPVGFEVRAPLPAALPPGAEGLVRLSVPPWFPDEATHVEVGLVQDGVEWHDARATARLRRVPGRRILVSTGVSIFPHLGDDLICRQVLAAIARHLPDAVPVLLAHPTVGLAERFGCEVATGPAAMGPASGRGSERPRRSRDLVTQARLVAKGEPIDDPAVAELLDPFATASALVIAPGGGLATRYAEEALHVCAVQALVARAFGLPVFLEGASVGPIEVRRDHAAVAQLLNDAQRITVRDPVSANAARRIGRAIDPEVVPDPATGLLDHLGRGPSLAAGWLAARNVPADRAYAVLSLRGGSRDAEHVATVRAAVEQLPEHTALIYLPHCGDDEVHDDLQILREDEWAGAHLLPFDASLGWQASVGLIAGASYAIGSRFHLGVLASTAGVPTLALVADEYDRLRARGLRRHDAIRIAELDDPDAAAAACRAMVIADRPEPGDRWDASAFAAALAARLPTPPAAR